MTLEPTIISLAGELPSSYNLGVAITTTSIFATLMGFAVQKKYSLRTSLRRDWIYIIIVIVCLSLAYSFIAETRADLSISPFNLSNIAAVLMISSIIILCLCLVLPIKYITRFNVRNLSKNLSDFLIHKNKNDFIEGMSDLVHFYPSLLSLSLRNTLAKNIFTTTLLSSHFLEIFSENKFLFEQTIIFYLDGNHAEKRHLLHFIRKLFAVSLNNKNSFLNESTNEDIYPDTLNLVHKLFLYNNNLNYDIFFFDNLRMDLNHDGKIAFLKLLARYFEEVYKINNYGSVEYEEKIKLNRPLVLSAFKVIERFFEGEFGEKNIIELFDALRSMGWHYQWGDRNKSIEIKNAVGLLIYEVIFNLAKVKSEMNDGITRIQVMDLENHFFETQELESSKNDGFKSFINRIIEKITDDTYGSNAHGYYPAVIKYYFLLYGFQVFSGHYTNFELTALHLPIFRVLKSSFIKLHSGYVQEYFNAANLPSGKEDFLRDKGRKIISDYLPEGMSFDASENALIYMYSGGATGSKISLNQTFTTTIESVQI